jgi:hypothetical protein
VQSKAVAAGLPADVVNFSISTDVDRLVSSKLVDKNWASNRYHGVVSKSVVVFVLRSGNPKHIRTWDDLIKPGVDVVFPNPFSSGGARWDLMAAYGAMLREGKTPRQAVAYLQQLFKHDVSQDTSGRNALNTFLAGKGDVLLTLRERREERAGTGQASLLPDPEGDAADRDAARRCRYVEQAGGDEVRQLALHAGGADDLGRERLPAGRPERRPEVQEAVPAAAAALQDRLRRRLEQGEHPVLRPDERHRGEDRAVARGLHWRLMQHGCRGPGGWPSALRP